jgi:hypothetical protein
MDAVRRHLVRRSLAYIVITGVTKDKRLSWWECSKQCGTMFLPYPNRPSPCDEIVEEYDEA